MRHQRAGETKQSVMVNRTHQPAKKDVEKSKDPQRHGRLSIKPTVNIKYSGLGAWNRGKASLPVISGNRSYVAFNEPETVGRRGILLPFDYQTKEKRMKKGDIVKIYEQPVTEIKYEGKAKLIFFIRVLNVGVELWRVKFLSDGEIVSRAVKN